MPKKEYKDVGRIAEIVRYPVKSMQGETVQETKLGWHGIKGDRRYGFLRLNNTTGFPWLTAREVPKLVTYAAHCENIDDPDRSVIQILAPNGTEYNLKDNKLAELIEGIAGEPVHLTHLYGGIFDANDVSLVTTRSMENMFSEAGMETDWRRFRPNIVVEAFGARAFPEEKWVGKLLVFGDRSDSARLRIYRKDRRCVVVNIDPDTGEKGEELLKVVARSRKNLLGVYAGTERPGTIAVGDIVRMLV